MNIPDQEARDKEAREKELRDKEALDLEKDGWVIEQLDVRGETTIRIGVVVQAAERSLWCREYEHT